MCPIRRRSAKMTRRARMVLKRPKPREKLVRLPAYVPAYLRDRITAMAKSAGITRNEAVRQLLEDAVTREQGRPVKED